jgi:hypothetical protein
MNAVDAIKISAAMARAGRENGAEGRPIAEIGIEGRAKYADETMKISRIAGVMRRCYLRKRNMLMDKQTESQHLLGQSHRHLLDWMKKPRQNEIGFAI